MAFRAPKYQVALRVIGQDLEELHLIGFNIKSQGKKYVIQGSTEEYEPVEFRYAGSDIEKLDLERRRLRSGPPRVPDFERLSQLLRAAGDRVEREAGRLRKISRQSGAAKSFTIQYDRGKSHKEEKYPVFRLVALCRRMCAQRRV